MGHKLTFDNGYYAFPTEQELVDFFGKRRWYDIEDGAASYGNADTGVYFDIGWEPGPERDVPVQGLSFEMNYGRPSFFGLEAAEELEALTDSFEGLQVVEGIGQEGPFETDAFLEAWNRGNRMAIRVIGERGEVTPPKTLPSKPLQSSWRWNQQRLDYQEELGGGVFVPRIMFFERDEGIQRGIIWPDAIPLVLPEVDMVLISLAGEDEDGEDVEPRVMPYEELHEAIVSEETTERGDQPVEHLVARWEEAPIALLEDILEEAEIADPDQIVGVSAETIFDRTLIDDLKNGL